MSEHPKAVQALMLANASVLVVNSENLHVLREGLLEMHKDFKQLLREQEATEDRHAAELRELKERFSEAAVRAVRHLDLTYYNKGSPSQLEREAVVAGLAPFILPAPDPLAEVIADVRPWDTNNQWNNAAFSKRLAAAIEARGGKIVWLGGGE